MEGFRLFKVQSVLRIMGLPRAAALPDKAQNLSFRTAFFVSAFPLLVIFPMLTERNGF